MSLVDFIKNLTIKFSYKKSENMTDTANRTRQNVRSSHNSQVAGRDIINSSKTVESKLPFIEIQCDTSIVSKDRYTCRFIFTNLGDVAATIQSFEIADDPIDIDKKTVTPGGEPYLIQRDLTNSYFANNEIDSPVAILKYKSLMGVTYATKATITQNDETSRYGKYIISKIDDNELQTASGLA